MVCLTCGAIQLRQCSYLIGIKVGPGTEEVNYIKAPHIHDTSIAVDALKLYTHLGGKGFLQQCKIFS
eukprot:2782690-Karenia_brevis.AAC.1